MLLLIDNYDSFVHNLARYFQRLGQETIVVRNDAIDAQEVRKMRPAALVLSPGPCAPGQAGASLELVRALRDELPMLGVCLGHQVIAQALGARIIAAPRPVHGQSSSIEHSAVGLFAGLPSPLTVGRYHSLAVDAATMPPDLRPTAWADGRLLMAFEHANLPVYGVQFHPESILTECGYELLANFLQLAGMTTPASPMELAAGERIAGSRQKRHQAAGRADGVCRRRGKHPKAAVTIPHSNSINALGSGTTLEDNEP
ncbi:MAG TPA: aminodeoxychorismate/anthranilate synthase component II, partial [Lacipirellulaceae bacterium]